MRRPRTPPSLRELTERAVHRGDLSFLTPGDNLMTFVRECEAKYRHWDKIRIIAPKRLSETGEGIDPELAWLHIKLIRKSMYRGLPLQGAAGQPVVFTIPDAVQQELMMIDRELGGNLVSDDDRPLDRRDRERFILTSLIEESIASSMLEGAATTRREAAAMLRAQRAPRTRGERMVMNNYLAIRFIREHLSTPMSPEFLLEIQSLLTRDTLDDEREVGRLRTGDDDIVISDEFGEVLHRPPDAAELPARLHALCAFANEPVDSEPFVHPVVRASALHFQIGVDHPFCDGNGRTARAVFYWHMLRNGYWLFEYLPISRLIHKGPSKYGRAFRLCETDQYDLTYFLMYTARILSRARADLREHLRRKRDESDLASSLVTSAPGLNRRQRQVVLRAARNPQRVFTIAEHQSTFGVSYATANTDLNQLADTGYLARHRTGNRFEFTRGPRCDELSNNI